MSKDKTMILDAVADVIKETRDDLRREFKSQIDKLTDPNEKLYVAMLYRKGVDARDQIDGFTAAYLHQRAHVAKGQPPAIIKRCVE